MKNIKWIMSTILLAVVLIFCIFKVTDIVERKSSDFKYTPFFEQKEDFDVLFMGTSHVMQGIFPMELWNDYGIVSYNFGGHSNRVPTTYWVMQNALDYTTPKLMVIDVLYVGSNEKVSDNSDFIHLSFDCFPVSRTKIKGIYDLCDDQDAVDNNGICYYDCRWEYIWNLGKYHSRWNEITENDITNGLITKEKGAESRIGVDIPPAFSLVPETEKMNIDDTIGVEYLRKMIEDCKQRGIEVLLVNLPYPAGKIDQMTANSINAVADEYGVNYINFVAMDYVVDYSVDLFDAEHLNPSGAMKVTDYLGQYIKEHYDIPDRRADEDYAAWNGDYQDYFNEKISRIQNPVTIENELMLLADKRFSSCIYIKEGSQILENEMIHKLIDNIPNVSIQNIEPNGAGQENVEAEPDIQIIVNDSFTEDVVFISNWVQTDSGIVMRQGEIIENGTHSELIENTQGLYHELFNMQAQFYSD